MRPPFYHIPFGSVPTLHLPLLHDEDNKNYVITSSIEEKIKPKTFCETLTPTLFIRNSCFVLLNLT